ncbi:MAG: hypothetical protein IJC10_05625 [Clostridia bacterium]|nr:hypothetical protein [Clostridia bacterium]
MADDINGDKITDYYTYAGYAEVVSQMTEEIHSVKKEGRISPYKVLIGLSIITFILLIIAYFIR